MVHYDNPKDKHKIVEQCDEEKTQKELLLPLSKATKRAAMYAGVSSPTINKCMIRNTIQDFCVQEKSSNHREAVASYVGKNAFSLGPEVFRHSGKKNGI
jgi:hypothetical protein